MDKKTQKPIHQIRLGRVRAAIWANEGTNGGIWHNLSFSRLYKNAKGTWRDSTSFGYDDLPLLAKLVDLAHDWCHEHKGESRPTAVDESGHPPDSEPTESL